MRESRTYGFVRGAHSNMRPYRDLYLPRSRMVTPGSIGRLQIRRRTLKRFTLLTNDGSV
jgi:hypothetical protein